MAKKPSEADDASLELARDVYNRYYREHVEPLVSKREAERMTPLEIAARIPDANVRMEFVRRSIHLLEANIRHDTFYATPIRFNLPFSSFALGTAVVLAALAYLAFGYVVAAVVAFSFIYGYVHARQEARIQFQEVESHNEGVPITKECNEGWERSLEELRAMRSDMQPAVGGPP